MNPYIKFVEQLESQIKSAEKFPLGEMKKCRRYPVKKNAKKVLMFSPHPDDECIVGLLPLRLMRELGMQIINVAVTQGSNKSRRTDRLEELENACEFLGWTVVKCLENGLEHINPETRENNQKLWRCSVAVIEKILREQQPEIIIFPHSNDWNITHIGTHWLVKDALMNINGSFSCFFLETEFWMPMDQPNLMVEADCQTLADLIAAASFHVEEVKRNPYHLLLPAWMQDNVRRGAELVGGQGEAAPDFTYATLYRIGKFENGKIKDLNLSKKIFSKTNDLKDLFC